MMNIVCIAFWDGSPCGVKLWQFLQFFCCFTPHAATYTLHFFYVRRTSSIITYYHNSLSWFYALNPIFMVIGYIFLVRWSDCYSFLAIFVFIQMRTLLPRKQNDTFRCGTACTLSLKSLAPIAEKNPTFELNFRISAIKWKFDWKPASPVSRFNHDFKASWFERQNQPFSKIHESLFTHSKILRFTISGSGLFWTLRVMRLWFW